MLQLQGLCQSHTLRAAALDTVAKGPLLNAPVQALWDAAQSKPCYKLRRSTCSVVSHHFISTYVDYSYLYTLHAFPNCGIFTAKQFLQRKKKKKVRSWRTGEEGEDMALPIIQKKEKGFTKKNHPKRPPKIGRNI